MERRMNLGGRLERPENVPSENSVAELPAMNSLHDDQMTVSRMVMMMTLIRVVAELMLAERTMSP